MKCYSCGSTLPRSGLHCPSCGQAIYTYGAPRASGADSVPSLGRRLDGYLPDTPSPSDFRAVPNLATLPREVDLRTHCSPVEDQGQIGSCVANAVVGALEYQRVKDGHPTLELSRMFVYFNARRMSGEEQYDSGSTIANGRVAFLPCHTERTNRSARPRYSRRTEDSWCLDLEKAHAARPHAAGVGREARGPS
jgi:hypothetical protein